jgi:hypothetical protein
VAATSKRDISDVPAIFARIGQQLHEHYVLGFSPESNDGRIRELTIQTTRPGITIHSRRSYVANQSNP